MKDITTVLEREAAVMTLAERLEAFCESIVIYQGALYRYQSFADQVGDLRVGDPRERQLRDLVEDSSDKLSVMAARAMALHNDSTFDRCIDHLKGEPVVAV